MTRFNIRKLFIHHTPVVADVTLHRGLSISSPDQHYVAICPARELFGQRVIVTKHHPNTREVEIGALGQSLQTPPYRISSMYLTPYIPTVDNDPTEGLNPEWRGEDCPCVVLKPFGLTYALICEASRQDDAMSFLGRDTTVLSPAPNLFEAVRFIYANGMELKLLPCLMEARS